jgi:hypothetical protein
MHTGYNDNHDKKYWTERKGGEGGGGMDNTTNG